MLFKKLNANSSNIIDKQSVRCYDGAVKYN